MSVISGQEYIRRIDDLKAEVWIEGEKVEGKISRHPAFSKIINSQARLYDIQLEKSELMTIPSPNSTGRIGISYLEPKTKEDLEKRRLMIAEWAKMSAGMLGRSPDYMNTAIMAFSRAADVFAVEGMPFAENFRTLYKQACENDLSFTHTFINPQVNRSLYYLENPDELISAQTTAHNQEGIIVTGARLLATQGGITDEILVFPTSAASLNKNFAYAFSIPSNTPGLKFICRESFGYKDSTFDHPLGSRFDEIDTIVVFDHVIVPWERVFCYQNPEAAFKIFHESSFTPLVAHQVTTRRIVKTEFILGVAQLLVDTINVGEYQHIQEKITEMIIGLESLKALLFASEMNAKTDKWGTMVPDFTSLGPAIMLYNRLYPRMVEIVQLIGASGLVSIPTERDFASEIRPDLEKYLQAANANAVDRVQLFRLGWDISMSAFGSRQNLYERFFFGEPVKMASGFYKSYDKSAAIEYVKSFLNMKDD